MRLSRNLTRRGALRRLPAALLVAVAIGLGLLAGCGDGESTGGSGPSTGPTPTPPDGTDLAIRLVGSMGDSGADGEWTLTCDPAGGTLAGAQAACDALAADPSLLIPPPCGDGGVSDVRSLRVTGTFRGRPVAFERNGQGIGDCPDGDPEAVAALLAALGDPRGETTTALTAPTVPSSETSLEIDLYPPYGPNLTVGHWTLTCFPTGGTLPMPEAACARFAAGAVTLEPPACTGDRITDARGLRVTGTLNGQPVDYQRGTSAIGECTGDQESISAVLEALGNPVP